MKHLQKLLIILGENSFLNGRQYFKLRKINLPCKWKVFGSPETFFQKGFWSPKAKIRQDGLRSSFNCSLAHPAEIVWGLTGRTGFMPVRSGVP